VERNYEINTVTT